MKKIYKLLSSAKQGLFAFLLTVFFGSGYSQTTYTFNYTGAQQNMTLPAGTYTIETWGADGGANLGNGSTTFSQNGGKGGYSIGTYTLGSPTNIYVNVGGLGSISTTTLNTIVPGGYNGGGYGSANSTSGKASGSGGGGASHVATVTGTLGALVGNQTSVIIVAGGGAGAGESNYINSNTQYNSNGGNGGALIGLQNIATGYQGRHGQGGTQIAGGGGGDNGSAIAGVPLQGIFGEGGYNPAVGVNASAGGSGAGGGGGGWYGGGSGWVATGTSYQAGSGGGGSGYIGGVISGTTLAFGQAGFVNNPDVSGNGMVLITELCSITLSATSINGSNPSICAGQSLTLTTNAISNYSWSTGATTSSIVVAPGSNTVYGLTATSPSNCTTSKVINVSVSAGLPVLSVNTSTNQTCFGKTVTLTATGALTYTWTNSVVNGVAFVPSATNTYTVIGQNGCGTVSAMTTVSVNPLPVSIVSTHTAVCTNLTATISLTSSGTSYTLEPGTVLSGAPNFVVSPQINTTYTVTASDGTCAGTANILVNALPIPTLITSVNIATVCEGFPAELSVTGAQTYSWTTLNQAGPTVTVYPTAPSAYPVVGTNSLGCYSSTSQIVFTTASPSFTLNTNQPNICKNQSATLTALGNAGSYAWTNGPTTSVNVVSPVTATAYTVTGTSVSNTCTTTKTIQINVVIVPLVASGNSVICAGQEVTLTASGAQNYNWVGFGNFPSLNITPTASTVYTLVGTTATLGLNCSETLFFQVEVNPNPTVNVVASPTAICSKTQISTLSASGASSYLWSNQSSTPSTTVSSNATGLISYSVVGTNSNNCTHSVTVLVKVSSCTGIESYVSGSNSIMVYPNPSQSDFTVKSESAQELDLVNELGQSILHISLNEANTYQTNVTGLSAGIYLLVGRESDAIINQRIVITR